ncbi:Chitin synthase 6 [Zancudomyces culisetae]|uniref:chitin synthase n=1 Tax=Zancudomyces culisetae TaxID=1213189 RepID=A0A1R1PZB7_ZANCU|nr:Chitin synthase 6 [Zancudomyces culisetae]|eukprot:OMH86291.1 Chitin synthase 6 [Zancudomyces culisetae]
MGDFGHNQAEFNGLNNNSMFAMVNRDTLYEKNASGWNNLEKQDGGKGEEDKSEKLVDNEEEGEITKTRKLWVMLTYMCTFLIPSPLLSACGMKRAEVRMAWREKITLCMLIVLTWAILLFMIIGIGLIVCPKQQVYTPEDVAVHEDALGAYVSLRGVVYDITHFVNQNHGMSMNGASKDAMLMFAGHEINASFPLAVRSACPDLVSRQDDPDLLMYLQSEVIDEDALNFYSHKVGSLPNSSEMMDPEFYWKYVLPRMKSLRKGDLVWDYKKLDTAHKEQGGYWRVINGEVFNLDTYFYTMRLPQNLPYKKWKFLGDEIEQIFDDGGARSTDISEYWTRMKMPPGQKKAVYSCMKQLFYVGKVDTRRSLLCLFTNYMLLGFACILVFVVLMKFLAALQFGSKKKPLPLSKFVICQVPCYTEGEDSVERTVNSLAGLEYPDKSKLLFIICDGNIVGGGNDRSTPRIVLDVLGVDPEYDPPARDALAIAEGSLQYNRGKVYSGLYEYEGHVVPFIVVVKVGNPHESSKPGNRGKRDSQILLMSFLNKALLNLPMTPLELEIYHQIRHIIGIPVELFEYLLQVDADTVVAPDSLMRLVAACASDARIAGICGETRLANEQQSWITMMQVYEYFISHHMAKAFESLFGAVTCLPGCFCMYRLVSKTGKPVLIASNIVDAYSERHVDTLHKKNLFSLGEDRYLTTLMLKHFPNYHLKFIRDAKCDTVAPEKWSVLVSQRRRWINSTVHNLFELVLIEDLCGFCCFSMRFVVMLDLFGTLTIPTVLIYMLYLVFISVTGFADVGFVSLIIIGAVYGLQAIIFTLRREWQHVGWMVIYLLCFPLWSFVLPVYSFWNFDDFSWGNTRTVLGDGKKKIITENDFKFHPSMVPQMLWSEYEAQLISLGQLNMPAPNMNPNMGRGETPAPISSRPGTRIGTPGPFGNNQSIDPLSGMGPGAYPTQMVPVSNMYNNSVGNTSSIMIPPAPVALRPASSVGFVPSSIVPANGYPHDMGVPLQQAPMMFTNELSDSGYNSNISQRGLASDVMNGGMYTQPQMQQVQSMFPPDELIVESIKKILMVSDLNFVSKKSIRERLSMEFGIDMTPKKDFISDVVDLILSGQL